MMLRQSFQSLFLLLAVLLCASWQVVRADGPSYSLVVYTVDGIRTAYTFADRPTMTIEGTTFRIRSTKVEAEYAATDILRFTLEEDSAGPGADYWLVVYTTGGHTDGFAFADRPEVRISEGLFNVSAAGRSVAYPAVNIERFTIEDHYDGQSVATAVEPPYEGIPAADARFSRPQLHLMPGTVSLSGLQPGTVVRVFDSSGRLALSATADNEGSLRLSMEQLKKGIYVVNTGRASFKIMCK